MRNLGLSGNAEIARFKKFIGDLVIDNSTLTNDVIDEFVTLFPANDPSLGAPFNTGDSLFDRAAAWYTDQMFLSPRRFFFQHASALQPMFAYYFREFIPGNDITVGGQYDGSHKLCLFSLFTYPTSLVAHASELELLFGPIKAPVETTFANTMRDFYINFVNDLHPGCKFCAAFLKPSIIVAVDYNYCYFETAVWPAYTPSSPRVLQLIRGNITLIPDGNYILFVKRNFD